MTYRLGQKKMKAERSNPAKIRLNEKVFETSFIFDFRACLQDLLFKTNITALIIRLQNTFS